MNRHHSASFPVDEALRKRAAEPLEFEGLSYVRLTDEFQKAPRGTIVLADRVIFGYPSIGRIVSLERGLREQFRAPYFVEEKIDGYNVRIFRYGDRLYGASRGGFLCPFTTDRIPDLLNMDLFDAEPDAVVCGEVAGPGNPYVESIPPFIEHDIEFFAFDLMRANSPRFLSQNRSYDLMDAWGLPAVRRFGRCDHEEIPSIRAALLELNEEHREGLVFKEDSRRQRRAKYVTANTNISDIRSTAPEMADLPPDYFTNRVLRLITALHEQGLSHSEGLEFELGAAFLNGLRDAVEQYEREGKVYRTFRCRFRRKRAAERFMRHLKKVGGGARVHIHKRGIDRDGDHWLLEFDRLYPGLNGLLSTVLGGGVIYD